MLPIRPDSSFTRDGRPLAAWLLDLVSEERPVREAAAEALGGMWRGLPRYSTPLTAVAGATSLDFGGRADAFAGAVRIAVEAPGFPTEEFVRRLCLLQIATKEDWLRRVEASARKQRKLDAFQDRLIERALTAMGDAEREAAIRRFLRLFCASLARDEKRFADAESVSPSGFMRHVVFKALDTALLADRRSLAALLQYEPLFHEAAAALARIGPPAEEFAPLLLDRLDRASERYGFDGAEALGSIARDSPVWIEAVLSRLREGSDAVRSGAAAALEHAGPRLAGRAEEAVLLLVEATHAEALYYAAVPALASVGRDREDALERVLELARSRPPRWIALEGQPATRYDRVRWERGVAIEALRYFRAFPERVVPALLDAFDTFEEYDPDYTYGGEHERVCGVLQRYGPAAAPAVPRLLRYLEEWLERPERDREWPRDVLEALEATGPAAAAALPLLKRLRRAGGKEAEHGDADEHDPNDPLDRMLLAFRGE